MGAIQIQGLGITGKESDKELIQLLIDAYYKLKKELEYQLQNLDAGNLNANFIKKLKVGTVVSEAVITEALYAQYGEIAELTVDELNTSKKVRKYLDEDTSDINYIKIYEQTMELRTAWTDGSETEQLSNRAGLPLFWSDDTHATIITRDTGLPVMIYKYTEFIKATYSFDEVDQQGYEIPVIKLGTGSSAENPLYGKGFIYKDEFGLMFKYISTNGTHYALHLGEDGIRQYGNTGAVGLRNIAVGASAPSDPQTNDLWIDTNA